MQYSEAFNSIGYHLTNPRQDWSAEKADGICITLWRCEIVWKPAPPRLDLSKLSTFETTPWQQMPGHRKRTAHLARAVSEFDSWLDVIILDGIPSKGVESAEPWVPGNRRNHRWRVQQFDNATGYFAVAAEKLN